MIIYLTSDPGTVYKEDCEALCRKIEEYESFHF